MIKRIQTSDRMSQAVVHGDTVYLAGQVAKGDSIATQTRAILGQVDALLVEAGSAKSNILSATIWLTSMDSFAEMNGVWDSWVSSGNCPARACVESPRLATSDYQVEIGIIAAVG